MAADRVEAAVSIVSEGRRRAQSDAAEGALGLLCVVGEPCLTVHRSDLSFCSGHRVEGDLYEAQGILRASQHFLAATSEGGESVNIVNVRAPSRRPRLKDGQRRDFCNV